MTFKSMWKAMKTDEKTALAQQTGTSYNYLSQIANGREPRKIVILGISNALKVSARDLFPNIELLDINNGNQKDTLLKQFQKNQIQLPV